jgi:hypothetical protein
MMLKEWFDAVIFLTWSDWDTEPRSNRYHFSSRFAAELPVLFLQHPPSPSEKIRVKKSGIDGIDLVNLPSVLSQENIDEVKKLLYYRGIKKPLLWIYDPIYYSDLIEALPCAFVVYHATEDYYLETPTWGLSNNVVRDQLTALLKKVDLLVACSKGVAESYVLNGGYKGDLLVSRNGCDAEFFINLAPKIEVINKESECPLMAVYQGGINVRLDYSLLKKLIVRMPDWEFHFCGKISPDQHEWDEINKFPNVIYHGPLAVEDVARLMHKSTVGLIPFKQDAYVYNSLPLKAYEYVACGLPVVTVPIAELEEKLDLFATAFDDISFENQIRRLASSRRDLDGLDTRRQAALSNSYKVRFAEVIKSLLVSREKLNGRANNLKIAVLYDLDSTHVGTIREHIDSFRRYSKHDITYIPATAKYWRIFCGDLESAVNFAVFDVVILHYSIRISVRGHLDEGIGKVLKKFHGLKILFIQDEYDSVEVSRSYMDQFRFDLIYSCVPAPHLNEVYPRYRYPGLDCIVTLTGYVPEDNTMEIFNKPLADREVSIAYRGRILPPIYGDLGYEKYVIGIKVRDLAQQQKIPVDIEVEDSKRIYGLDWYKFLGSARSTLGNESGANIFDFDGSIERKISNLKKDEPSVSYEKIRDSILFPYEGLIRMNQISPKIFEAIKLRTALILFEGKYSDIILPDIHFIPLKKDLSNIGDVFRKLQDDSYIEKITKQAYNDIVLSGLYSYKNFVNEVDLTISRKLLHSNSKRLLVGPLLYYDGNNRIQQALPTLIKNKDQNYLNFYSAATPLDKNEAIKAISDAAILLGSEVNNMGNTFSSSIIKDQARHLISLFLKKVKQSF